MSTFAFLSPDQVKKKEKERDKKSLMKYLRFSRESLGSADKGFVCSRLL